MKSWQSLAQLARDVHSGKTTATANVEEALRRIDEYQTFKAVIAKTAERALERAATIDAQIKQGEHVGRLAGVPFIAKDNFLVFGADTTAASNILKGFDAPYQSTAIERLEAEGAICVAKANLDAFGHGGSTENSDFFTTLNPHDKTRVPGGSSGGSAVAVVLGMVPFALGTDTGGSSRQPASYSGCIGYKPTYGLISRSGVIAMASSTDTVGVLSRTSADLGLVVDVIAGQDSLDSTTIQRDEKSYEITADDFSLNGKTIGLIGEYMGEGVDQGVKKQITQAVEKMKAAGATIKEISIPSLPLALAVYYVVVPAEISSNLSRYDGQRYGYSDQSAMSLDDSYKLSRTKGFGKEAKRRIMIGTYVLSSGYYDAYYRKAQTVRTKLINEFNKVFQEVDYLAGPVAPTTAFRIGENTSDPLKMYLSDIMTVGFSLVGAPAISIPAGMSDGLPVGLQLSAPQKHDRDLISLACAVEGVLS